MALMSLLVRKGKGNRWVIFAALLGAALIYGDGAITPAISVLSALEGLNIVIPHAQPYILPATGLFSVYKVGWYQYHRKPRRVPLQPT